MTNYDTNIARFDAYLYNEMSADEHLHFEHELSEDENLFVAFEEHKKFLTDFNEGAEYREIHKKLNAIHDKLYHPAPNFFLSRKFLIPLALAASVVLIVLAINPFVHEGETAMNENDYQELGNSSSEEDSNVVPSYANNKSENTSDQVTEVTDSTAQNEFLSRITTQPIGTGFLISVDGYFLTSKHLVEKYRTVKLQQKEQNQTFHADVVYIDSLKDFAILKCHPDIAIYFKPAPYRFLKNNIELGEEVFTLGYPKNEIVYTKGVISSETGYHSDSLSFEISLPSNPGYSGAPLFTCDGDLIGIINGNNNRKQAVTYVLNHHYIKKVLNLLDDKEMKINTTKNYTKRYKQHTNLVSSYRAFVFEVHPGKPKTIK